MMLEYQKVKSRIDQVSDYNYLVELKSDLGDVKRELKENDK